MTEPMQPLDALTLPLRGARLIEASAGTGKTWTIAALYLRLVLGHGGDAAATRPLTPREILVMTFTRAATRELSDRIRARLGEAAAVLRGELPAGDALLDALCRSFPEGEPRQLAAWRAAQAAAAMDEAAIHTIDAWCQRVLREHALASGSALGDALLADEAALRFDAVRDFWRVQVYPLPAAECEAWLAAFPSVDALAQSVSQCLPRLADESVPQDAWRPGLIADVLAESQASLSALKVGWAERAEALHDWLAAACNDPVKLFNGNKLSATKARSWCDALAQWARSPVSHAPMLPPAARKYLSPTGLLGALNKDRTIAPSPLLSSVEALLDSIDALPRLKPRLLQLAARAIAQRIDELKQRQRVFGFADPLRRLDEALQGEGGEALRQRLLAQYPVALIDEFQDTSPLQWRVFERLYRPGAEEGADKGETALLLIGDPKQSIYGFRGADIHSYLQARHATAGRHYALNTNHRSTDGVVGVVNALFEHGQQRQPRRAFALGDALPFQAVQAAGRAERLTQQGTPVPALTLCHGPALRKAGDLRRHLAALAAEQVVAWLNDPACGFAQAGQPLRRLRAADIAVLVRNRAEARFVQQAFDRRGLRTVFLSDQASVFLSPEAMDVWRWLQAVANPLDGALARAAYATVTLGLPWAALAEQVHDEAAWDARVELLRELQRVWQRRGVLAMLRLTLHRLDVAARLLAQTGGERSLTNLLHLAELLQGASQAAAHDGEEALVRWLGERIEEAQAGVGDGAGLGDERIVRLESDEALVQVITVHKSKGLEYPVVLLPFATAVAPERKAMVLSLPDATGRRRVVFDPRDDDHAQARDERLQEDLRLLYVALTRARHALWLGVGLQKKGRAGGHLTAGSALGYLLGVADDEPPEHIGPLLQAALGDWAGRADAVRLVADELPPRPGRWQPPADAPALSDVPAYSAAIDRNWAIGSYSSVVRGLGDAPAPGAAQPCTAARDVLTDEVLDADLTGGDTGTGSVDEPPAPADAPWHRFPRGALAGNFLHDQLQWLAEEGFDRLGSEAGRQALRRRCERAGHGARADDVQAWLDALAVTPLPPVEAPLGSLDLRGAGAAEMEFWLPSAALDAAVLDELTRRHLLPGVPRPSLPQRRLRGLLMGFADLVFEHDGRWWVLDYKSNALGADDAAYRAPVLAAAMASHRYDVQAALYMAALHRLLRHRLGPEYDPARHLGGAVYLFLRGIRSRSAGCVWLPAEPALLRGIDRLLDGTEATA